MPSDHSRQDDDSASGDRNPESGQHTTGTADRSVGAPASRQPEANRAPNTLLNALIGAVVTVVTTFFIPLSPLLGGAIAGYLEGESAESGLRVGALSGVMALVPLLVVVPLGLALFIFEPIAAVSLLVIAAIVVGFLGVYTVGFSALGGLLGVYLYEEFGSKRA